MINKKIRMFRVNGRYIERLIEKNKWYDWGSAKVMTTSEVEEYLKTIGDTNYETVILDDLYFVRQLCNAYNGTCSSKIIF